MVSVRAEQAQDRQGIYNAHAAAFSRNAEADLVETLRAQGQGVLSLVAVEDGVVVGHVLFSPVSMSEHPDVRLVALGPVGVVPDRQRRGIGSLLVRAGLDACGKMGLDGVVVLGHPDFYPRFGFVPASRYGIKSQWDVPDEVFMAIELRPNALQGVSGKVRYHQAFDSV